MNPLTWPLQRLLAIGAVAAALAGGALAADELQARLQTAQAEAGASPQRARARLQALREDALAAGRLDLRLAVDDAECRVLVDLDSTQAQDVARAGLVAAGGAPGGPARGPWLRLRACLVGAQLDAGEDAAPPLAELERLLADSAAPADVVPHALALLERGAHRSRAGAYELAQQDLIAACEALRQHAEPADRDHCLAILSGHYRRVGDLDEAMALLKPLREAARARAARYDEAIVLYNIGQIERVQERWAEAMRTYEASVAAAQEVGDSTGAAYAEHGIALTLLKLGRPAEALAHAERTVALLAPGVDDRQRDNGQLARAEALVALGRSVDAMQALDLTRSAVYDRGDLPVLAGWLATRARAAQLQGRWQDAYTALAEARRLEEQLQAQRLSQNAARLRMQFNRQRDAEELSALRQLNAQGQRLRQTQALALVLFVTLLAVVGVVAVRKFRQARALQSLALTDELTGLANRRGLLAHAAEALERTRAEGRPLAMLMIDVDHFKRINDSHGHAIGDAVLRQLAHTLNQGLRERDRLGRVGGEEFIAVLPDADEAAAALVAERMRAAVAAAPLPLAAGTLRYTVSIGVAGARELEPTEALIGRADAALYRAKAAGRDAVRVDEPLAA